MAGPVQIVITLTPEGTINCTGPLENKLLCYGLLKMAEGIVANYKASKIVEPGIDDLRKLTEAK